MAKERLVFSVEGHKAATVVIEVESIKFPSLTLDVVSQLVIDALSPEVLSAVESRFLKDSDRLN